MAVEIPDTLKREVFRFLKLPKMQKFPPERNWTEDENKQYTYHNPIILEHLKNDGNVGIMCGRGRLIIIDCDGKELEEYCENNLPKTLTVLTPTKKLKHFYYFSDWRKPIILDKEGKHYGEIRNWGLYIVAPCSKLDTGTYEIKDEREIADLSDEELEKIAIKFGRGLKDYGEKLTEPTPTKISPLVEEMLSKGVVDGSRHKSRFMIIKDLWNNNISNERIKEIILKFNVNCSPPDDEEEVLRQLDSLLQNPTKYLIKSENDPNIIKSNYGTDENISKIEIIQPGLRKPISDFASEVGKFFSERNLLYFRPIERNVVRLEMIPQNNDKNKKILGFKEVKSSEFITFIEKYFNVGINIYDKKEKTWNFELKSIPKEIAETTLESSQLKEQLPVIDKIFTVPLPLLDKEILVFPINGYDKKLWSWMPYNAPKIVDGLSLDDAKKIIDEIYKEFCFKTEQDKINAIAALLTPFCRRLYSRETCRTPIFFYKANRERAGKDYCAGITGIVFEGVAVDEPPITSGKETHDEEFRKKILSAFKMGRNRIHISNNKGFINSSVLEMLATSENFSDRQLGSNTILQYPNTLEISLSANTGITYTPDLSHRSIFINLFLAMEEPNNRKFEKPNLHEWIKTHREEILSALYSLVKNWYFKGMPPGNCPFSSYSEWARVVGGIMEAAGYNTPCVNNDDQMGVGGDLEAMDMKKLFELSFEQWGEQWIEKKVVMDEIDKENSDFNELFSWFNWDNPKSARTKFSILLRKYVGREMSGIKLMEMPNPKAQRSKYMWTKNEENFKPKKSNLEDFI